MIRVYSGDGVRTAHEFEFVNDAPLDGTEVPQEALPAFEVPTDSP